jgi:hypothetical protein
VDLKSRAADLTGAVPGASSVRDVGSYIREQRNHAQISLRQLARQAGVSNP